MQSEKELLADLVRLELLDHVVQESIVKVFATQEGVTIGGLHLKHTACRCHLSQALTIKCGITSHSFGCRNHFMEKLYCHMLQLHTA